MGNTMWKTIKLKTKAAWTRMKSWALAILVALGLVVALPIEAGPISFTWTNPVQNTDGTPFDPATELAEIRLYCNGDLTPTFVSPGSANALDAITAPGTYVCYATAVNIEGTESAPSNTATKVVLSAPPNPPVLD